MQDLEDLLKEAPKKAEDTDQASSKGYNPGERKSTRERKVTKIEDIGYVEKDLKKQNLKNRAPSVRSNQPRWEPKELRKAVLVSPGYKTAQMVLQQLFTMKEIEIFQPGYGPAKHFPSLQRNPMDFNEVNRRLG